MVNNRSSSLHALAAFAATIVLVASMPDSAYGAKKKNNTEGREEFERAARYYKAQEYEAALPWFQKAYELSGKRASVIRALAQCERSLKMYDEAILHFREYLATRPAAAEAKSVRKTIDLLEELRAPQNEPEEMTPPIGAPPVVTEELRFTEEPAPAIERPIETPPASELREVPPPRYEPTTLTPPLTTTEATIHQSSNAAPWIVIGGSVAAAIFGATLFAIGRNDVNKVETAPVGTPFRGEISDAAGRAPTFTALGIGMAAAGLAGAGIGVTMLLSDD